MVDSERLIMVIENFECLWNTSLQEYHNKNLKDLSWTIVCQELIEDWAILNQNQKKSKLNDIKKRWHNIRDYYKKEIDHEQKNIAYGQTPKKRKKYVFADILEFLRPVYENRHTIGNYEIAKPEPAGDETLVTSVTPSPSSRNKSKKRSKKQNTLESSLSHKDQENEANDSRSNLRPTEDDPDLMFLKSLLPDLKALTSSEKFDFKIGIMQMLRSIKQSQTQTSHLTQDHSKYCIPSNRNIKIMTRRTSSGKNSGKVSGDVEVQYILPHDVSNNVEIDTNTYFDHTMSDD